MVTGTIIANIRQNGQKRPIHSARSGFFDNKYMAVFSVPPTEHARVYPFTLLVGSDEDCSNRIANLFHPVAVGTGPS